MSGPPRWHFSDTQHPPRPPAGQVGVYTGSQRVGTTQRLLYKSSGIHVTVTETRGRFTCTSRWQYDGRSWSETTQGLPSQQEAQAYAKVRIDLLRSIVAAFGEGQDTERIEELRDTVLARVAFVEDHLERLKRELP